MSVIVAASMLVTRHWWLRISFLAVVFFPCFSLHAEVDYYTADGIGPDKWASVWLLEEQNFAVSIVTRKVLQSIPSD